MPRIQQLSERVANQIAAGEVVEINEAAVDAPGGVNLDPYEAGWLVILQPEDWDNVKATLVLGTEVAAPYEAKMAADGFDGCE